MVSYTDAEKLSYLAYKRLIWSRLVEFWESYGGTSEFVERRLTICRAQLQHWEARS